MSLKLKIIFFNIAFDFSHIFFNLSSLYKSIKFDIIQASVNVIVNPYSES